MTKESEVYHYELYTGAHIPDELLTKAKEEKWEFGQTNVRPPTPKEHVAVFSLVNNSWYVRRLPNDRVNKYSYQWEINPLALPSVVDAKNHNFFVYDNIFMDIETVINDSKKLNYDIRTWNFHGLTSDIAHCSGLLHAIGKIVGRPVTYHSGGLEAGFKITNASDWYKHNRVHVDYEGGWAVIIYLDDTQDPRRKGTSLHRHKDFDLRVKRNAWTDEMIKEMYLQGHDKDNFEPVYTCPVVKNRMFIYRSDMFHSVAEHYDSRNVFRMFLKERTLA